VSRDGAFRAAFPGPPRRDDEQKRTVLGTLRSRGWELEAPGLWLRIERHDLPALAPLLLGERGLLQRAKRGLLEDAAARDVREEPIELRGHPGLRLRFEPAAHPGEREEARLFVVGRRLYALFARGTDARQRAAAERFLDSVEIDEP
jgi:hypothetical protein